MASWASEFRIRGTLKCKSNYQYSMTPLINKFTLAAAALAGLSYSAVAADSYSVFHVCEDQHILRTSDGADAGHLEYIVVEPGQQRIVSTVITGGVVGTRHVSIPYSEFQVTGEREIVLRQITRERIVGAPIVEVDRFRTNSVIEPSYFEKSSTYFGVDVRSGGERGRDIRDPRGDTQLKPGERTNDPRNAVRDDQKQARPGDRANDPRNAVRDDQKQAAPGERANDPRSAVRDDQKQAAPSERANDPKSAARDPQNMPPKDANARDNRNGALPDGQDQPTDKGGQAGTNSSSPADRNGAQKMPSEKNTARGTNGQANQDTPAKDTPASKNARSADTQTSEKSRADEKVGKAGNAGNAESNRPPGTTAKEKKAEGTQKSDVTEGAAQHSKKAESAKEDKPSRGSADKKEPKSD